MAGRTPHEARANFVEPLQRALSCVSDAVVYWRANAPSELEILILSQDPVRLSRQTSEPLLLTVDQQYTAVVGEGERGPWKVATRGYRYQLQDESGHELAGWHWHPDGRSREQRPHLHVHAGPLAGLHLPTGRVSLEAVLRLLVAELGVRPRRVDWEAVLDEAEGRFTRWRTWG